jgi:hypothetical protein
MLLIQPRKLVCRFLGIGWDKGGWEGRVLECFEERLRVVRPGNRIVFRIFD